MLPYRPSVGLSCDGRPMARTVLNASLERSIYIGRFCTSRSVNTFRTASIPLRSTYCDDCEVRAIQSRSEMVERGNFLDAWCAPSRPDIEQHDLAPEVGKASWLTLIILKADHGTWFRCFVYDEVSRRLLGEGDRHRHKHRDDRSNAIAQALRHGFRSHRPCSESHIFDRIWQPIMSVNYLCYAKMLGRTAQTDLIGIRYLYLASSVG